MIRFLHSADWQLGARFRQFGAKADLLRQARLDTLRRSLELARKHAVDACLIAGDLFEDNQVEDRLVADAIALFAAFPEVPVYLLPGNHDPETGPDSVWHRRAFLSAPAHVHVLREAGVTDLGGGFLLASPLHQKLSTTDPSLKLAELTATLPADVIKIGLTHGALAIEGKHQPNDFPIALNAASRAGLDYLAVGHWHNWLAETDGGRIVMPGTPEPEQFDQDGGSVALVEISAHGASPKVERLPVAGLHWRSVTLDFLSLESSRAALASALRECAPAATVLRITLSGSASPQALSAARAECETLAAPFLVSQIQDRSTAALGEIELQDLRARHPILAQVLADIDRLESLATGKFDPAAAESPLSLAEVQQILGGARIDLAALTPAFFGRLRQVLLQTLQEAGA